MVVLAIAALVFEPAACLQLLAIPLALVMSVWAWDWRRPAVALRVHRFQRAVRKAAEQRNRDASVYRRWGSSSKPDSLVIRVAVPLDADRDDLLKGGFLEEFNRLLTKFDLPVSGQSGANLTIDSQETVDRDFDGNWYFYDK